MPSSIHVLFFIIQFNGSLIPWTSTHLNRLLKTLSSSLYLKARNAEFCNGDTPREHREVMPHYSLYREEKSLHHVAMVETFLDDNKPKLHLLNENSHCFKLHRSYSLSFNLSNVGEIFWIESERKRKRNFLCCVHLLRKAGSVKLEVSCRSSAMMAIKCAKKRHALAQLLFTNINLLPFCRSRRLRRRCWLSSLLLWSKHFSTMVTWRHTSPLYWQHWINVFGRPLPVRKPISDWN